MLIALAIFCTLCEAVFTALEVALGAVSRAQLRAAAEESLENPESEAPEKDAIGRRRIQATLALLEQPERLTLLFITVTSLSLWAAATLLTWQALSEGWPIGILVLALVGVLFVAEVLPVLIAARHADALALAGTPLVRLAQTVLAPLVALVSAAGYGVASALGSGPGATAQVTKGELKNALAEAEKEGFLEGDERALLEGAMEFREKVVREVMTPRHDIIGIEGEASLGEILEIALREGHSRLPAFEGSLDKILGIVATKDLLPFLCAEAPAMTAREVVRPAFFVPETKKIAPTLEELRRQRTLLAIVVDESGSTVGLVTLEDLLEELVGEIQDEYDVEEPPLRVVEENCVWSEASESVREWERFWEREIGPHARLLNAEDEDADDTQSLAALALELFQNVPNEGDRVRCGALGEDEYTRELWMEIVKMSGPRIEEVQIGVKANSELDPGTSAAEA